MTDTEFYSPIKGVMEIGAFGICRYGYPREVQK
mgnify:CR=1 FL=1